VWGHTAFLDICENGGLRDCFVYFYLLHANHAANIIHLFLTIQPPPSYQPEIPTPSTPATAANSSSRITPKPQAQDLISRYNLASKIDSEVGQSNGGTDTGTNTILRQESAWSQNRSERQRLLQNRRDDMIIAARKKMQERDRMAGRS
jgi:coupling of ubiquitin conjugation to ER degradation protein 1